MLWPAAGVLAYLFEAPDGFLYLLRILCAQILRFAEVLAQVVELFRRGAAGPGVAVPGAASLDDLPLSLAEGQPVLRVLHEALASGLGLAEECGQDVEAVGASASASF